MSEDAGVSELADRLAGTHAAECWEHFESASLATRTSVVRELKARVDRLVRSDPAGALPVSEALVKAVGSVPQERVVALRGRAVALYSNGDKPGALAAYRAAERLASERGDELEMARIRRSMVDVLQMSGRASEALEYADLARRTFAALGEERLLAQLEVNVGNVYFRLDDYERARARYEVARELFERLQDRVGLAFAVFNIGNLETEAYEYDSAERAFRAARAIMANEGMEVVVADCDYSLAYLEFRRGHFGQAIRGLEDARRAYAVDGKPSGVPSCDLDLAEVYVQLDLRRDALRHARLASEGFERLELDYENARARILAAVASYRLGDAPAAQADLDVARGLAQRLGNESLRAFVELQRLGMQLDGERARAALPQLRAAWETLDAAGRRFLADVASVVLTRALIVCGQAQEAVGHLERLAAEVRESTPLERTLGPEIFRTMADARFELGDPEGAAAALQAAVSAIEAAYLQVPGTDARMAFFRRPHEAFVELARLRAAECPDDALEALSLLERSRGRSSAVGEPWRVDVDGELRTARERLDSLLGARLDAELGVGAKDRSESPPSDVALVAAERELARIARERALDPGAASGTFDPSSLQRALLGDEVLLAYLVTRRGSVVLVATSEGVQAVPIALDPERLRVLVQRLAFQVRKFRLGEAYVQRQGERLRRSSDEIVGALGEALLGPVRSILANRPLVIVPYGILHNLPFHALHLERRPLLMTNEVSYAPSLALLERCRRPPALAGPVLLSGVPDGVAPEIEGEVAALERLFAGRVERVDPAQLPLRLARDPATGGILHIAAHGTFRPGHPVFSGVRLGPTFLTVHDIRQMQLDLDLVTLSGCETGRKADVAGEQLFSPDYAFLAAGVRTVLSSLWVVRDEDSARMMQLFYRRLAQGHSARGAAMGAQRELFDGNPHPWVWAPFIVTGNPLTRMRAPGVAGPSPA